MVAVEKPEGTSLTVTRTIREGIRLDAPGASTAAWGTTVGRYLVIDKIGMGGMGVVIRAYDPKLQREIALKRLHRSNALDPEGEARLLREAQAMAQLSHPNVVTIYDVERIDDDVVMAMEYVEGQTLSKWIDGGPNPWREVLEHFDQAGRGLLAAHVANLVHRDFKPSNVILGPDGRARVMDFGLVRAEQPNVDDPPATDDERDVPATRRTLDQTAQRSDSHSSYTDLEGSRSLSIPLTEAGTVMGTPPYMAPEQHRGEIADARSDQYSFCVSLWEALWGTRPFVGSIRAIILAKRRGAPSMARGSKVPRRIYEALQRGLEFMPAKRWPSMAELLAALSYDPAHRRRTWLASSATLVLVAVATAAWSSTQETPCRDARDQLDGVWDNARRAEVEAALLGTELSYAPRTWARVSQQLDSYAEQWVQMHTHACEATAIRKVQSETLLDLRMQCLRHRKVYLRATVDVLAHADAEVTQTAIEQVAELPSIDHCANSEALVAAVPPPEHPDVANAVKQLRDELTRARALTRAAHYSDARQLLDELRLRAASIQYAPLEAELLEASSSLASLEADYPAAVEQATRAYELALQTSSDPLAVGAATTLMMVTGEHQSKVEVGRAWATSARVLARRADPSGVQEATILNGLGVLAYRDGDFALATTYHEQALPKLVAALGNDSAHVATTLDHIGDMLDKQSRYTEAESYFRRAIEIETEIFGSQHPRRATPMNGLALSLLAQGREREARDLHLEVIELRSRTLGKDHPETAFGHNNLGWDYMAMMDLEAAASHFERAIEILRVSLGPEHPRVATSIASLATAEAQQQHYDRAETLHHQALEIRRKALGDGHVKVALSFSGLAHLANLQEHHEEVIGFLRQALAIVEAKPGGAEHYLGGLNLRLGRALLKVERFAEARPHLELGMRLLEDGGINPVILAQARLQLVRALEGEGDHEGANAFARESLEELAGLEGDDVAKIRDKFEQWLGDTG